MESIVVDTKIFIDGCTFEGNDYLHCHLILTKILDGVISLGVDNKGEILEEYNNNLMRLSNNPIAKLLIKLIINDAKFSTGERRIRTYKPISKQSVRGLLKMGFHRDYIKFVRIAPKTDLKAIFSSNSQSFLNYDYSSWMQENLGVSIKQPSDFPQFILEISNNKS